MNQQFRSARADEFSAANSVNVIFSSDEAFLPYTAVTLASLLSNFEDARRLNVFLLTDAPLTELHRNRYAKLTSIRDFALHEVLVGRGDHGSLRTTPGISEATYFRLSMHTLIPFVDKALYLDSDLTILGNVAALFDTDMTGFMFAGVEDSISQQYNAKFNLPREAPHINAGVAVVNLAEMRSGGFSKRVSDYVRKNRYLITLGDQQIINAACHDKIKYVPLKWNVHGSMFDAKWTAANSSARNSFTIDTIKKAAASPAIIHYTLASRKPWLSRNHPRAKDWIKYAELTPYAAEIIGSIPSQEPAPSFLNPTSPPKPKALRKWPTWFQLKQKVGGYYKSVLELRTTRLAIDRLVKQINGHTAHPALGAPTPINLHLPAHILDTASASLFADLGALALKRRESFSASAYIDGIPPHTRMRLHGVGVKDIDGGFHENIKIAMRTATISNTIDISEFNHLLIMSLRTREDQLWHCLNYARSYGKDAVFAEISFFAAFGNIFDPALSGMSRKAFGFILDDMGFYFDARNPSRLETFLNSDEAALSEAEVERARALIRRVIKERITKYNAYAGLDQPYKLPQGCVVVIDQKAGDASIEFGGATARTFELMADAAIRENPGKPVFFKVHPDNRDRANGKYRSGPSNALVKILPDDIDITKVLDASGKVYTVTSQVGFEALLRGKQVEVFGQPFYAGWGLTNDRQRIPRRKRRITVEELFHAACIRHSVYVDPRIGEIIPIEKSFDLIADLRSQLAPKSTFC